LFFERGNDLVEGWAGLFFAMTREPLLGYINRALRMFRRIQSQKLYKMKKADERHQDA
jgi:hypothetical protein